MWLVVTECLWRNCIFIFFFTFELLYSLTIESWDGTFLRLKKGSWDPLNLHTQFFEYCNKKKGIMTKLCVCVLEDLTLGKGQPQGSQETHRRRGMAFRVWCLLPRYEDLSSEPPHPQKVKCGSHVSKPSTKASPRARCLCILNSPCALGITEKPCLKRWSRQWTALMVTSDLQVHVAQTYAHIHICHKHTNESVLRGASLAHWLLVCLVS